MLLPVGPEPEQPDTALVPEIVSIDGLSHDAIEKAEAEIEAEENEWPATV